MESTAKKVSNIYDKFSQEKMQGILVDKLDNLAKQLDTLQISQNYHSKIVYTGAIDHDTFTVTRNNILNEIQDCLYKLEESFDDIVERLTYFGILKEKFKMLKSTVNKNEQKYYYRSCIIVHDSILHIKSEKLTHSQLDILKYIIKKFKNNIDVLQFNEIDDLLAENGLDWIPEGD